MVFEHLKVKPKQRATASWANAIVDAIEQAYWLGKRGDPDYPFKMLYGEYGFFSQDLFVQGKHVIKDGDPVNIYDIFPPARETIRESIDASIITQYMGDVRERVLKLRMDEYGNIGVTISEPIDVYGRVVVSVEDAFKPVHASAKVVATENTAGLQVTIESGGRPYVNLYYKLGGAGDIYLEGSNDGQTWRPIDSIHLTTAEENTKMYQGIAFRFVRARVPTTGIDVELELVASR